MKKAYVMALTGLIAAVLLGGCVAAIGNRDAKGSNGTLGQELVDLKKAKDAGALSDAEYEAQKARLIERNSK